MMEKERIDKEFEKLVYFFKETKTENSKIVIVAETLEKWFDNSAKSLLQNSRYIVYAIFAFCWSAILGIGIDGFFKDKILLVALVIGFLYLFVDLLRCAVISFQCRYLTSKAGQTSGRSLINELKKISLLSNVFLWIQLTLCVVLIIVMVIFLIINLSKL